MMIRRRHVFHIAGYDPTGVGWYRIFRRELASFARTWNLSSSVSELMPSSATANQLWTVTTHAPNWLVEATYEPLLWDDIVCGDFARPMTARFGNSMLA